LPRSPIEVSGEAAGDDRLEAAVAIVDLAVLEALQLEEVRRY